VLDSKLPSRLASSSISTCSVDSTRRFMTPVRRRVCTAPVRGRGSESWSWIGVSVDTAKLRAACGAGGTAKGGVLEIQGDHCARVIDLLRQEGRTVKRTGG
jgi:cation transport regulator ChaC